MAKKEKWDLREKDNEQKYDKLAEMIEHRQSLIIAAALGLVAGVLLTLLGFALFQQSAPPGGGYGLSGSQQSQTKTIQWQNPLVEAFVRESLNKPMGDITQDEADQISRMVISGKEGQNPLGSLADLKYLRNLTVLDISYYSISDVEILGELPKLAYIALNHTAFDGSKLPVIPNLREFYLQSVQYGETLQLKNLSNALILDLSDNGLTDISMLAEFKLLQKLYLPNNRIEDVSPLGGLTQLQFLNLENNLVSDVSPLSGLVNLEELNLMNNPVADWIGLEKSLPECLIRKGS